MPELPSRPISWRYYRDYLRHGGFLILDTRPAAARRAAAEFEGTMGLILDHASPETETLGAVLQIEPPLPPGRYRVQVYRQEETHEGNVRAHAHLLDAPDDLPTDIAILILGRSAKGPADPLDFIALD